MATGQWARSVWQYAPLEPPFQVSAVLASCRERSWCFDAEEAELGLVAGDGRDGIAVADALDLGDEGARGGGIGKVDQNNGDEGYHERPGRSSCGEWRV